MNDLPPVSALCLTYGRPNLLEEAIYSFLQQDYAGVKELIVLNDLEDQLLSFEHPEVRVINIPKRFRSLGEKRNASVALASHDILFPWDDDDIIMPNRLSFSIKHLSAEPGYFNADSFFMRGTEVITNPISQAHASCCFTRAFFQRIGGYQSLGKGEDTEFENAAEKIVGQDRYYKQKPADTFYLYRWWGTDSYHASGKAHPERDAASVNARVGEYVRKQITSGEIPSGNILLQPKWRNDYQALMNEYVGRMERNPSQGTA